MKRFFPILVCVVLLSVASTAGATVPRLMSFQGKLTNNADQPLTGNYNFTFRIYGAATGGAALWTEVQNSVSVETGIYNVLLGSVTPLNLAFDTGYWMSVEVGADGEMTPRYRLTSAPYSLYSDTANSAVGGGANGVQRYVITGTFDTSASGDYISSNNSYDMHYKVINDPRITLADLPHVQVYCEALNNDSSFYSGSLNRFIFAQIDAASYFGNAPLYYFEEGKIFILFKLRRKSDDVFFYFVLNGSEYNVVIIK